MLTIEILDFWGEMLGWGYEITTALVHHFVFVEFPTDILPSIRRQKHRVLVIELLLTFFSGVKRYNLGIFDWEISKAGQN